MNVLSFADSPLEAFLFLAKVFLLVPGVEREEVSSGGPSEVSSLGTGSEALGETFFGSSVGRRTIVGTSVETDSGTLGTPYESSTGSKVDPPTSVGSEGSTSASAATSADGQITASVDSST